MLDKFKCNNPETPPFADHFPSRSTENDTTGKRPHKTLRCIFELEMECRIWRELIYISFLFSSKKKKKATTPKQTHLNCPRSALIYIWGWLQVRSPAPPRLRWMRWFEITRRRNAVKCTYQNDPRPPRGAHLNRWGVNGRLRWTNLPRPWAGVSFRRGFQRRSLVSGRLQGDTCKWEAGHGNVLITANAAERKQGETFSWNEPSLTRPGGAARRGVARRGAESPQPPQEVVHVLKFSFWGLSPCRKVHSIQPLIPASLFSPR